MKITGTGEIRQSLLEDIQTLQLRITLLYKERDRVLSEIKEQRRGKSEVYSQKVSYQNEVYSLEQFLEQIYNSLDQRSTSFYERTDKQQSIIKELAQKITDKTYELCEYEKKELIDIDAENKRIKETLKEQKKDVIQLNDKIKTLQQERDLMYKEKEEFIAYKEKEEAILEDKRVALNRKQAALDGRKKALSRKKK